MDVGHCNGLAASLPVRITDSDVIIERHAKSHKVSIPVGTCQDVFRQKSGKDEMSVVIP